MCVAARLQVTPRRLMERHGYADLRVYAEAFGKEIMAPLAPVYAAFTGGSARGKGGGRGRATARDARDPWFHYDRPYQTWEIDTPAKWTLFRATFGHDAVNKVGFAPPPGIR